MSVVTGPVMRKYDSADLSTVHELIMRTIDACYAGVYPAEAIEYFKQYHDRTRIEELARRGVTIVLEAGGRIVGVGAYHEGHISRVFVDPALQRRGYGLAIMRRLEEMARESGVDVVDLDVSLPSREFYRTLGYGFVRDARTPVANGKTLDYCVMSKNLRDSGDAGGSQ